MSWLSSIDKLTSKIFRLVEKKGVRLAFRVCQIVECEVGIRKGKMQVKCGKDEATGLDKDIIIPTQATRRWAGGGGCGRVTQVFGAGNAMEAGRVPRHLTVGLGSLLMTIPRIHM